MSPLPVIAWGAATAALLSAAAFGGAQAAAVSLATSAFLVSGVSIAINWRLVWNKRPSAPPRAAERTLVFIAVGAVWIAPLVAVLLRGTPLLASTRMEIDRYTPINAGAVWTIRADLIAVAVATVAICLASVIDWSYTRPRLSGGLDGLALPCQQSTARRWRTFTALWLLNRIVAYGIVSLALAAAVVIAAWTAFVKLPASTGPVIAAGVGVLVVYYFNRIASVLSVALNPPLQIGDEVVLAEEYGTGVDTRAIYYVVDISLEGVQLLELDGSGAPLPHGATRVHDRTLELKDIRRLLRSRRRFSGCKLACAGVNRYCPHMLGIVDGEGMR